MIEDDREEILPLHAAANLFLLGQRSEGIRVVDEPDLHLHRAYLLAHLDRGRDARAALLLFVALAPRDDPRVEEIRQGLDR